MRQAYAHDAVLIMEPDTDVGAAGAAITVALCGRWKHEPPCPLAPHHTAAHREGDRVRLRILFATEPARLAEVRAKIAEALRAWRVVEEEPGEITDAERDHADRLAGIAP
nr:hypothetical protein [uncultured Actinoplanes sp.]